MEKDIPCKWVSNTAGLAIPTSDKIDFKRKTVITDKEGHYIIIKRLIHEEDIAIVNIYALNIWAPQYIRQILTAIKREINSNRIIVRGFTTPLTAMDRSSRQKLIRKHKAQMTH